MSIELHVYSTRPPLPRDEVARELLWHELPPTHQWEIRFMGRRFLEESAPDVVREGPLAEGVVLGWHPDSPHAAEIEAALESDRTTALDSLSARNRIASAYLSVLTPESGEEWEEVIESIREDVEETRLKNFLRGAKTFYSVETSATRNALSLEFQTQLWRMIWVLSYGLSYDPQEGELDLFEEEE